ncbi:MAG: hypothetical protein IMF19_11335 [Proteobacteria bacterium]|jgi:hypothetical protein|nr:hypothetical protein [Pseudomonadota bacterium]
MNGNKIDFWILLWSCEDLKIDGLELRVVIQRKAPDYVEIKVKDSEILREMELKKLKRCLGKDSVLIIYSSEKAENEHSWRLGFIMGQLYTHSEKDKDRIIVLKKGNAGSLGADLLGLVSICKEESEVKEEITHLVNVLYPYINYKDGKRATRVGL